LLTARLHGTQWKSPDVPTFARRFSTRVVLIIVPFSCMNVWRRWQWRSARLLGRKVATGALNVGVLDLSVFQKGGSTVEK
jgi:hypothetical protein